MTITLDLAEWVKAAAMASYSSSYRFLGFISTRRGIILIIGVLSLLPSLVIAAFISGGEYSKTAISFFAAANAITPLASATRIPVFWFLLIKSVSIDKTSGSNFSIISLILFSIFTRRA